MNRLLLKLTFSLLLAAFAFQGHSETLVLNLEECLDSAYRLNGNMKAAAMEIERAGLLKGTAFNPPKTSVALKQETTGGGGPDNGVAFTQEFEFPTVYVERGKALKAQEEIERNNYALLKSQLGGEIASQYNTLLYQQELLRLNEAIGAIYVRFHNLASTRYELGDCSALEKMNAGRMVESNSQEHFRLQTDYETEAMKMMTLTGCSAPVMPKDSIFAPLIFSPDSVTFIYDNTPAARLSDSEMALIERNTNVARHELLPDITLGATVQALIKSFNPYHIERERFRQGNFMAFEVGISVPLFFGAQKAKIKASEAELNIARMRKETDETEAQNAYQLLLERLKKACQALEYYQTSALSQAEEIRRLADISYEYGEIDYMEYINNMETYYTVKREYVDAIQKYNQTILQINQIIGTR